MNDYRGYADTVDEKLGYGSGMQASTIPPPPPRPSPINCLVSDLQEFAERVQGLSYRLESAADRLEGPVPEAATSPGGSAREPSSAQDWCYELRQNLSRLERQADRLG